MMTEQVPFTVRFFSARRAPPLYRRRLCSYLCCEQHPRLRDIPNSDPTMACIECNFRRYPSRFDFDVLHPFIDAVFAPRSAASGGTEPALQLAPQSAAALAWLLGEYGGLIPHAESRLGLLVRHALREEREIGEEVGEWRMALLRSNHLHTTVSRGISCVVQVKAGLLVRHALREEREVGEEASEWHRDRSTWHARIQCNTNQDQL